MIRWAIAVLLPTRVQQNWTLAMSGTSGGTVIDRLILSSLRFTQIYVLDAFVRDARATWVARSRPEPRHRSPGAMPSSPPHSALAFGEARNPAFFTASMS
jgi:hypothetical protein